MDETTDRSTPGAQGTKRRRGAQPGNTNALGPRRPWSAARRGILTAAAARETRAFIEDLTEQLGGEAEVTPVLRARIEGAALARATAMAILAESQKAGSLTISGEVTQTRDGKTTTQRRPSLAPLLIQALREWNHALAELPTERKAKDVPTLEAWLKARQSAQEPAGREHHLTVEAEAVPATVSAPEGACEA